MAYTKLFQSILTSTIWVEPDRTRIVWITMLALADKNGEVQASIPGLARVAGVPISDCEDAITRFLAPDPYSRTPDDEGRRIEKIEGGWVLLNHEKYRRLASKDESKEAAAERQRRKRERDDRNNRSVSRPVTPCHALSRSVTENRDIAEADTDTDADNGDTKELGGSAAPSAPAVSPKPAKVELTDDQWLAEIAADSAYAHVSIPTEWAKMHRWCSANRKQPTRRRFINWINRIDRPVSPVGARTESDKARVARILNYQDGL